MVGVILPVRDGSRVVARQLTALLAQTFLGPWELVVVDNGSLDDTYALATNALAEHRPPQLRRAEVLPFRDRHGYASPRNFGATQTSAGVLAFCDADDEVAPGWLEALHSEIGKHSLLASHQVVGFRVSAEEALPIELPKKMGVPVAHTGGMCCTRELFEQVAGFDTYFDMGGEDVDFSFCCLRAAGVTPTLVEGALYYIGPRSNSAATFRQGDGVVDVVPHHIRGDQGQRMCASRSVVQFIAL